MEKAAFALVKYSFDKIIIDYSLKSGKEIKIQFKPKGVFEKNEEKSFYNLTFNFIALSSNIEKPFVDIECNALFEFADTITFEEIPSFFYANSIAIIFPYLRAFVSTVTLQANKEPIVLPTMNLSSLEKELRDNTIER
jgi:preprotein translocase subunit SecB